MRERAERVRERGDGDGGGVLGILGGEVAERTQFGRGVLNLHGLRARFARGARGRGPGARSALRLVVLGFQALEFFEGAVVVAAGGIDAALEAAEGVCAAAEGLASGAVLFQGPGILHFAFEDLGIDSSKAAEQPFVIDEGIDEEAFFGGGGLPTLLVFGGEGFEVGGILAADDLRFGVNAGFGGIETGDGLARDGAWTGGLLRVETVRFDLLDGGHK